MFWEWLTDKESSEWKKWSVTGSLILASMLNSLTPAIAVSVEALPNAFAVWSLLSVRYSGKGHQMLVSQIEDRVHVVPQGDRSVSMCNAPTKSISPPTSSWPLRLGSRLAPQTNTILPALNFEVPFGWAPGKEAAPC